MRCGVRSVWWCEAPGSWVWGVRCAELATPRTAACAPRRAKILFDVEAPRRVSMLAAMSPSFSGSSRKSINAGAIAPELKAMAEASKRRTT